MKAALRVQPNSPFEQIMDIKDDETAPLDLSKKRNSTELQLSGVPLLPVKSEPEECEVSGQSICPERPEFKEPNSHQVETDGKKMDPCSEAKRLQRYPIVLSLLNARTAFPGPGGDVKREDQSHLHPGASSTRCSQLEDMRLKDEFKKDPDA